MSSILFSSIDNLKSNNNLSLQKIVGIYCESINHFVETIAYWLTYKSSIKVLIITQKESQKSEHPWCLERIKEYSLGKIVVMTSDSPEVKLDYLFILINSHNFIRNPLLKLWLERAQNIGILTGCNYQNSWKNTLKEFIYSLPYSLQAKNSIFQVSNKTNPPYFFIKNKSFYSPSVHPQCIVNDEYRKSMFAPFCDCDRERTFRFSFIGNRNPPERLPILKQLRARFMNFANIVDREQYLKTENISNQKINVLWIEYGDNEAIRGLDPADYIQALRKSDFSICPLGWGGNWTHRVIESLLQGAIPILEDAERYNINLQDMHNCLIVKNNNWLEAITRAEKIPLDRLVKIKSNIAELRNKYLLPEVAAKRLQKSIGLA